MVQMNEWSYSNGIARAMVAVVVLRHTILENGGTLPSGANALVINILLFRTSGAAESVCMQTFSSGMFSEILGNNQYERRAEE